jgi:hypothetical protein
MSLHLIFPTCLAFLDSGFYPDAILVNAEMDWICWNFFPAGDCFNVFALEGLLVTAPPPYLKEGQIQY